MKGLLPLAAALLVALTGCATDPVSRPGDPYFSARTGYLEKIDADLSLRVACVSAAGEPDRQCFYKTVDESYNADPIGQSTTALSGYFSDCPKIGGRLSCEEARNRIVNLLVKISDDNCSAFLHRTFFLPPDGDLTKRPGPAVAVTPPTALDPTKAPDGASKVLFLNEMFQPLESAIHLVREEKKNELDAECGTGVTYARCSIYTALAQVRSYSDACSLRVGVSKLQAVVQQRQQDGRAASRRDDDVRQAALRLARSIERAQVEATPPAKE